MENPAFYLLFAILVVWVASYFYSIQFNRRKLTWLARWLEDALPLLGSRFNSRWSNQDTLTITFGEGRGHIREAAIVLGAQRRELFSYILSRMRGGKDTMNFVLAINPPTRAGAEFEVFKKGSQVPKTVVLGLGGAKDWQIEDYPRNTDYQIASRTETAYESASRALTLLLDDGYDIRRLSVRPTTPHLMLVFNMQQLPRTDAHDLLQLIRNLSEEVAQVNSPRPEKPGTGKGRQKARQLPKTPDESADLTLPPNVIKLPTELHRPDKKNPFSKN